MFKAQQHGFLVKNVSTNFRKRKKEQKGKWAALSSDLKCLQIKNKKKVFKK